MGLARSRRRVDVTIAVHPLALFVPDFIAANGGALKRQVSVMQWCFG